MPKLLRPKKETVLPKVLAKEEIKALLKASEANEKHYLILMLLYGGGLRIGEVLNLKITDIEAERNMLRIRQGKGKKDRYTLLPTAILDRLRRYLKAHRLRNLYLRGNLEKNTAAAVFSNLPESMQPRPALKSAYIPIC